MALLYRSVENKKALILLFLAVAVFASLQAYFADLKTFEPAGVLYTTYNNYVIFRQSLFHLVQDKDLYILYEKEQWDLYKYSPAFALFFGVFALLPDAAGLMLWNLTNSLVLVLAVYYLPKISLRNKGLMLAFVFFEMLTSLQNEQSNGLIAGLLVLAFGLLERDKYWLAALCVVGASFVKPFGIVALALYLLYPDKVRLTYTTAAWVVFFTFVPLLVVDWERLIFLYKSWANLLANDHSASEGLSVASWLKTWFGWPVNKTLVSVVGAVLFCLPLLRIKANQDYTFRLLLLASVLVWVVIFNHKAESPTFIIAVSGVALWYFGQAPKVENLVLLLLALVFTVLAATDVFPRFIQNEYFQPYVVKAVPCILVWGKITFDLLTLKTLNSAPESVLPAPPMLPTVLPR